MGRDFGRCLSCFAELTKELLELGAEVLEATRCQLGCHGHLLRLIQWKHKVALRHIGEPLNGRRAIFAKSLGAKERGKPPLINPRRFNECRL